MTERNGAPLRLTMWAVLLLSLGAALVAVAGPTGADGEPMLDGLAALGFVGVASLAAAVLTQLSR